jgi:CxxC motif-containing protein (DUF1111 family)
MGNKRSITVSRIMLKLVVVVAHASVLALSVAASLNVNGSTTAPNAGDEKLGGETTVYATGRNAFSFPAANLDEEGRTRFAIGNSFFKRNWVEAPASTTARDGLGPHFIARSCAGCHVQDGRGEPPRITRRFTDQPISLLMRISVPGMSPNGGPMPEPTYGDQLNNAAIQGVKPEAKIIVSYRETKGRLGDGSSYSLRAPHYRFTDLAYGPIHAETMVSPRIAPQVIGLGLLEAIPENEILANQQDQSKRGDAIKGQPNRVWDAFANRQVIGRFGWKANVGSLAHQTAGAFLGDMGITSSKFSHEACTEKQADCRDAPRGNQGDKPEIDDKTLDQVIFYQTTIAVPARRNANATDVRRGEALFHAAQCAACHRPSYKTGTSALPALSNQSISPYTDLLLHDMGEGLADHRPDFLANGRQWRTPPLWGIGLIRDVNGHSFLLHDGRARNVLEAILWHGGEAETSKQQVKKMKREERNALIKFVESL